MNEIDFTSYADGNAPYLTCNCIEDDINSPESDLRKLFKWFCGQPSESK